MVETREWNKSTHPGQLVVPRPRRTREQAAADCAAKATALQQKEDKRMDSISGLASLEQRIMGESQQAMTQAARPPLSQVRKIARTYSVHNLQTMENENLPGMRRWIVAGESLLIHWTFTVATVVDQMGSVPMDHGGSKRKKMTAPKPKLRQEVAMATLQSESVVQVKRGKRKATEEDQIDKDQYAVMQLQILINTNINNFTKFRSNKQAKPSSKPSGLRRSPLATEVAPSYFSREPSPNTLPTALYRSQTPSTRSISSTSHGTLHSRTPSLTQINPVPTSKPPSSSKGQHATPGSANMPVNDYGGFHDEDESVEQNFAVQHQRTTLNSKV